MTNLNHDALTEDLIASFAHVGYAAVTSYLQSLSTGYSFDMKHGLTVHGEAESITFFRSCTGSGRFFLTDMDVPLPGRKEIEVTPEEAATLIRNLTPEEIVDYIGKRMNGKPVKITDYIGEDEMVRA